ncbi:MAG: transposase [Chloroflexi bacterium]|nr:MAG: transposase [Chloroflexota bacterium]
MRIPPAKAGGHPRTLDMRRVVNAILYLLITE